MKRQIDLREISDGRLYGEGDMARVGCGDCAGCSACCRGMGDSILLDPLDVYRLAALRDKSFEECLAEGVELGVAEGLVLPHLKMIGAEEQCAYLTPQGRCSIHPLRPGFCRLFPLGRYYENGTFRYFLQVKECKKPNRTKVKVGKWIDTPDLAKNRAFVTCWHDFLEDCRELVGQGDDALGRNLNLYLLRRFYLAPYEAGRDFYGQFYERMDLVRKELGMDA